MTKDTDQSAGQAGKWIEAARSRHALMSETFNCCRDLYTKEYARGELNALEEVFGKEFFTDKENEQ